MSLYVTVLIISTSFKSGNFKIINIAWYCHKKISNFLSGDQIRHTANKTVICCLYYI